MAAPARSLVLLFGLGLTLRLLALPLPGTLDTSIWKIWAFSAANDSPARLYGVGGSPPERRRLGYDGRFTTVDYPPLTLDVLAVVGRVYQRCRPSFPDGPALTVAVKIPSLLADLALACGVFLFARRRHPSEAGRTVRAYWLSPAVLLNGAALGYLDPLCALPATAAFMAAAGGWWWAAGALGAAAALVKAQGAVPMVAVVVWAMCSGWRSAARLVTGAILVGVVGLAPVVLAGGWPNFLISMASLTRHNMVSGNATNPWWIYTWVFRAYYDLDQGAWAAFTQPVRVLGLNTVAELGHLSPKPLGLLLTAGSIAWAVWRVARVYVTHENDDVRWPLAAALGAFIVHAYYMWTVPVHENHLYLAVPLALVAAIALGPYRRLAWAIGVQQALNLFLFYGISEGIGWLPPRDLTVVDTTVVLAALSLGVFAWHVRVLALVTGRGSESLL